MANKHIQALLQRDMTRKEFLSFSGLLVCSVFGVFGLVEELQSHASTPSTATEPESGTISGDASRLVDASASGGAAVEFGAQADRGALPIGQAHYPLPTSGAVCYVSSSSGSDSSAGTAAAPLKTVKAAMAKLNAGGTIVARTGTYHETLSASSGKIYTIQNYPGEAVWFDGSSVYSNWTKSGSAWTSPYTVNFARISEAGYTSNDPYAGYQDQVFINGTALAQIADNTAPAVGQFSVNLSAQTITIGSDPTSKQVNISDLATLAATAAVINFYGVGIRRYATASKLEVAGMLYFASTATNLTIENVVFDSSANAAMVVTAQNASIRNVTVQNCGFGGIYATNCDGLNIEKCAIQNNNLGRWIAAPACGGIKITRADSFKIDNNLVSEVNVGNGIWLDVSCTRFKIINNTVAGGGSMRVGIQVEESDGGVYGGVQNQAIIANNEVSGTSYSGIAIWASGNIEIYNNYIYNYGTLGVNIHQDRGKNTGLPGNKTQAICPWYCANNTICNNRFSGNSASATQFLSYDDYLKTLTGATMTPLFAGNWFAPVPPGAIASWGNLGGTRTTCTTLAALDAVNSSGTNYQSTSDPTDSGAQPLPADVAAALGVSAGTKHIGLFV